VCNLDEHTVLPGTVKYATQGNLNHDVNPPFSLKHDQELLEGQVESAQGLHMRLDKSHLPLEKVEHAARDVDARGKPVSRVRRRWLNFLDTRVEKLATYPDEIKALSPDGSQMLERLIEGLEHSN
jgi:hypothetical protein